MELWSPKAATRAPPSGSWPATSGPSSTTPRPRGGAAPAWPPPSRLRVSLLMRPSQPALRGTTSDG
jgi:hypothetical protein